MEDSPAFDLNREIRDWRTGLSTSPALQRDGLDELESHLRDSIATLMEKGLSDEEALLIAVRRCGTQKQLQTEFSKSGLIESLIEIWFFRTAWILLGFLALLNGYSLWLGGAKAWDVYPILGLRIPNFMLVVLAVTALNTLQLRHLAKARIQNSKVSVVRVASGMMVTVVIDSASALYWLVILAFCGSLFLASHATVDILCGAFLSPTGLNRYRITQAFSGDTGFSIEAFFVAQILILVLLLAVSGISACLRKICARKSIAVSSCR